MSGHAEIHAGFMPLIDCAPLVVAGRLGFAEAEGLRLSLHRESSWAALRDRVAVRHLDVAHMLAPMPIAASLGLTPLPAALIAPLSLGTGANTITVSEPLWRELANAGAPADLSPSGTATAFAAVVSARRGRAALPIVMAIVHAFSVHHYQLAYWLASAGVAPGIEVELVVVPPTLMPSALAVGQIEGFCAGEPWGSIAAAQGSGRILTTGAGIWHRGPEKVLGVRQDWADANGERLQRLIRAVHRASLWCDDPDNHNALIALLGEPAFLDQPELVLRPSLERKLRAASGKAIEVDGLLNFAKGEAAIPRIEQALWIYSQMVRCGQTTLTDAGFSAARSAFRPDLALAAIAGAETGAAPRFDAGSFFDGRVFDPERLADYLAGFPAGLPTP